MIAVLPCKDNAVGIIYCTTNLTNGKKYIGQHNNVDDNYFGSGIDLKADLKLYGTLNFQKEILQYCVDVQDLNESEAYWIEYFGAKNSDLFYNKTEGGKGNKEIHRYAPKIKSNEHRRRIGAAQIGHKMPEVTKLAIKLATNKPIVQLDLQGNLIAKHESITSAIKFMGKKNDTCCIRKVLKKQDNRITAYGFKWMYLTEFEKMN